MTTVIANGEGAGRPKKKKPPLRHADPHTLEPWLRLRVPVRKQDEARREWQKGWKSQLAWVAKNMLDQREDGKGVLAFETQHKTKQNLYLVFSQLREEGFKVQNILSINQKHLKVLFKRWAQKGLAPSTISNLRSTLNGFCGAIGKCGFVPRVKDLGTLNLSPAVAARTTVAREDKSWTSVEFAELTKAAHALDLRYGLIIELMWHFGLRGQEAWMLEPHIADSDNEIWVPLLTGKDVDTGEDLAAEEVLHVIKGTKGGRYRAVLLDTPEQRDLINRCKASVLDKNDSVSGKVRGKLGTKDWYEDMNERVGATLKGRLANVPHGLRHSYCHAELLKRGVPVSIKGEAGVPDLQPPLTRDEVKAARLEVSENLGHSRVSVTGAYSGTLKQIKTTKNPPPAGE